MLYQASKATAMEQRLNQLESFLAGDRQAQDRTRFEGNFNAMLDEVSKSGEIFSAISDPKERDGFIGFLVNGVNPPAASVNPEMLRGLWLAYKQPTFVATIEETLRRQKQEADRKVRNAAGDSTGPRPAAAPPAQTAPWADLLG
jgi:hypothetical protein